MTLTGPEHYARAAEMIASAAAMPTGSADERWLVGAAAVHASLAQTAALLETAPISTEWAQAIGRPATPAWRPDGEPPW